MRRTFLTLLASIVVLATGAVAGQAIGGSGVVAPPPDIAFLANGLNPADALAAGGIAGQLGAPLFTTGRDALESAARDGLIALDPDLVIILGGPAAIAESVANEVAAALGLAVTTADAPRSGILRVAGPTRFETAAAVATLLTRYRPAYLPVGATALGALEAAVAEDSVRLGGLDASAFALADRACVTGAVVIGIGADGTPTCTANVQRSRPVTDVVTSFLPTDDAAGVVIVTRLDAATRVSNAGTVPMSVAAMVDVDLGDGIAANLELSSIELCIGQGSGNLSRVALVATDVETGAALFSHDAVVTFADDACTAIALPTRFIVDPGVRPTFLLQVDDKTSVDIRALRLEWTPTTDALAR